MNIAVIAVAYNRINSLSRLLSSLSEAYYNDDCTLIISVDKSKTTEVEDFADSFEWIHGRKVVDKHDTNLGLRSHMLSLGKWFDEFDAIIVLEDDIVVSKSFYYYAQQTVEKYKDDENIAGISLYSPTLQYSAKPFVPIKTEYDAYFLQIAQSWGEIWMKKSWTRFYEWYQCHSDFPYLNYLPVNLNLWGPNSWLKYHSRYCIEENKFFVYPYCALSTNSGDIGTHAKKIDSNYQVVLQAGKKDVYALPGNVESSVYYDGFHENIALSKYLNIPIENLCIDIYGLKGNLQNKQYWLTTRNEDFEIIQSFGLSYRPIEMNVILKIPGQEIFLYNTNIKLKNQFKDRRNVIMYLHYMSNISSFLKLYKFSNICKDIMETICGRLMLKFKKRR